MPLPLLIPLIPLLLKGAAAATAAASAGYGAAKLGRSHYEKKFHEAVEAHTLTLCGRIDSWYARQTTTRESCRHKMQTLVNEHSESIIRLTAPCPPGIQKLLEELHVLHGDVETWKADIKTRNWIYREHMKKEWQENGGKQMASAYYASHKDPAAAIAVLAAHWAAQLGSKAISDAEIAIKLKAEIENMPNRASRASDGIEKKLTQLNNIIASNLAEADRTPNPTLQFLVLKSVYEILG